MTIEEVEICPDGETDSPVLLMSRAPFTQIPDWILLADISHQAVRLYCLLAMHLNAARGDRLVWPSRATLATMMGLAQAKSIDGPLKELVKIGAIRIAKRKYASGGWAPSRFLVWEEAPEGYVGVRSATQFYDRRKANSDESPARDVVPDLGLGGVVPDSGLAPDSGGGTPENRPRNKNNMNKKLSSSLREDESRVRDAPARATTPPARDVSSGSADSDAHNSTLGKPGRGALLSADWEPTADMLAAAAAKQPGIDLVEETDKFRDHFVGNTKFRRTPEGWQGAWRNWLRRAWRDAGSPAPTPPDLFAAVDEAAADRIVEPWLAHWAQRGTVVTPVLRTRLRTLVGAALAAGRGEDLIKEALRLCREPFPAPWNWDKAMAGIDPHISGSTMSRQEQEQKYRDDRSAREWQHVAEVGPDYSGDDAARELIARSMRKAGIIPAQDSTPGPATSRAVLRGEIAQ